MRIYLSGPMRGRPNLNRHSFDYYVDALLETDEVTEVFNPWVEDPDYRPGYEYPREEMIEFMSRDISALEQCDAIFMMPEWWTSRGAVAELAYAHAVGIPATDYLGRQIEFNTPRNPNYLRTDGHVTAIIPLPPDFRMTGVSRACGV